MIAVLPANRSLMTAAPERSPCPDRRRPMASTPYCLSCDCMEFIRRFAVIRAVSERMPTHRAAMAVELLQGDAELLAISCESSSAPWPARLGPFWRPVRPVAAVGVFPARPPDRRAAVATMMLRHSTLLAAQHWLSSRRISARYPPVMSRWRRTRPGMSERALPVGLRAPPPLGSKVAMIGTLPVSVLWKIDSLAGSATSVAPDRGRLCDPSRQSPTPERWTTWAM